MAVWGARERGKAATEPDSLIRTYTETVMQTLQKTQESGGGPMDRGGQWGMQNDAAREIGRSASHVMSFGSRMKYTGEGSAYWDVQFTAPDSMQQYGFCRTTSQKYGSLGSKKSARRITWMGISDVFDGNVGSRYFEEEEFADGNKRVPLDDSGAAVPRTVLDDIAAKKTLRKLSTLKAVLENAKGIGRQVKFHSI